MLQSIHVSLGRFSEQSCSLVLDLDGQLQPETPEMKLPASHVTQTVPQASSERSLWTGKCCTDGQC